MSLGHNPYRDEKGRFTTPDGGNKGSVEERVRADIQEALDSGDLLRARAIEDYACVKFKGEKWVEEIMEERYESESLMSKKAAKTGNLSTTDVVKELEGLGLERNYSHNFGLRSALTGNYVTVSPSEITSSLEATYAEAISNEEYEDASKIEDFVLKNYPDSFLGKQIKLERETSTSIDERTDNNALGHVLYQVELLERNSGIISSVAKSLTTSVNLTYKESVVISKALMDLFGSAQYGVDSYGENQTWERVTYEVQDALKEIHKLQQPKDK